MKKILTIVGTRPEIIKLSCLLPKLDKYFNNNSDKVLPIIVHGDAAIAGQGLVYELVQMARLDGYETGGTIHIVVNNQVGFTTNYLDGRSSTYCTDVGKVTLSPVLHVNADDVEAVVHAVLLHWTLDLNLKEMYSLIY